MPSFKQRIFLVFVVLLVSVPAWLFAVDVPYIFSNGEVADAEQVNENFSTLADALGTLSNTDARPLSKLRWATTSDLGVSGNVPCTMDADCPGSVPRCVTSIVGRNDPSFCIDGGLKSAIVISGPAILISLRGQSRDYVLQIDDGPFQLLDKTFTLVHWLDFGSIWSLPLPPGGATFNNLVIFAVPGQGGGSVTATYVLP